MAERTKLENGLTKLTKNVQGAERRVYKATFYEVENFGQVEQAAKEMGLTVSQVSDALVAAKAESYKSALETTPDKKIENAIAAFISIGYPANEAKTMAEAQRGFVTSSLPVGLEVVIDEKTGQQKIAALKGLAAKKANEAA